MINDRTVFIIGAGANKSYEMPTGRELRDIIISQKSNADYFSCLNIPNYSEKKFIEFCTIFEDSNVSSIDEFLKYHPELKTEGKIAIAFSIKQHEEVKLKNIYKDNWMQYLYNVLIKDITKAENAFDIGLNSIYFLTFNYDRFLDYFFAISFYNTFKANTYVEKLYNSSEYESVCKNIGFNITHVYGQIGNLFENRVTDPVNEGFCNYFSEIQIINEREKNMEEIHYELRKSKRVFFLGYGFNQENNDLLNLKECCAGKEVYATGYKLYPEEHARINSYFDNTINISDCDSYNLLRKYL